MGLGTKELKADSHPPCLGERNIELLFECQLLAGYGRDFEIPLEEFKMMTPAEQSFRTMLYREADEGLWEVFEEKGVIKRLLPERVTRKDVDEEDRYLHWKLDELREAARSKGSSRIEGPGS